MPSSVINICLLLGKTNSLTLQRKPKVASNSTFMPFHAIGNTIRKQDLKSSRIPMVLLLFIMKTITRFPSNVTCGSNATINRWSPTRTHHAQNILGALYSSSWHHMIRLTVQSKLIPHSRCKSLVRIEHCCTCCRGGSGWREGGRKGGPS